MLRLQGGGPYPSQHSLFLSNPNPTPNPNQGGGPYPSQHSLFLYDCTDETGRVLGPASDVFSLGALLHELPCLGLLL